VYNGWVSLRRAAIALTAAAVSLAFAGTAGALIRIQTGIAGAELSMSRPEVKDVLGQPNKVKRGVNDFGPYRVFQYRRLAVTFQGEQEVTAVTTRLYRERTRKGIGRGSTEAQLRAVHTAAKCRTEFGRFRHCWIGKLRPGKTVADFRIRNGKVSRVTVGYVID
jgi:hypothetical protein